MRLMLVDENPNNLSLFETECTALPDFEVAASFSDAPEALEYAKEHPVDLGILDTVLPQTDGFTLA